MPSPSAASNPRGSLETDDIIARALEIADAEGLNALTMRRLAGDLGIGVMTLYGHVRTKEELVARLTERAIEDLEVPTKGAWDRQLSTLFTDLRELLWNHPSVLYADTLRPLSGPTAFRAANESLRMLRDGGLSDADAVAGMSALIYYTFGAAMFRLNQAGPGRAEYELHVRGAHPDELQHISELAPQMLERGSDDEFAGGLRLIVDGLKRQGRK